MFAGHEERYARQMALPQAGRCDLEKLAAATVVIGGCGGLDTVSAELLARAGVGHLRLVDDDRVEPANLVGQTLFDADDARAGQLKVVAASRRLGRLNPAIHLEPLIARLNARNADRLTAGADPVLDSTDNDATRFLIDGRYSRGLVYVDAWAPGWRHWRSRALWKAARPAGIVQILKRQGLD
jgi:adenylyltransferase/sulfurtransferase